MAKSIDAVILAVAPKADKSFVQSSLAVDAAAIMVEYGLTGIDLTKIVRERVLKMVKDVISIAAHGTEMAHIKDCCFLTGCEMFGDRATAILEWHRPTAERHDFGPQGHVLVVEKRSAIVAHRQQATAQKGPTVRLEPRRFLASRGWRRRPSD